MSTEPAEAGLKNFSDIFTEAIEPHIERIVKMYENLDKTVEKLNAYCSENEVPCRFKGVLKDGSYHLQVAKLRDGDGKIKSGDRISYAYFIVIKPTFGEHPFAIKCCADKEVSIENEQAAHAFIAENIKSTYGIEVVKAVAVKKLKPAQAPAASAQATAGIAPPAVTGP